MANKQIKKGDWVTIMFRSMPPVTGQVERADYVNEMGGSWNLRLKNANTLQMINGIFSWSQYYDGGQVVYVGKNCPHPFLPTMNTCPCCKIPKPSY